MNLYLSIPSFIHLSHILCQSHHCVHERIFYSTADVFLTQRYPFWHVFHYLLNTPGYLVSYTSTTWHICTQLVKTIHGRSILFSCMHICTYKKNLALQGNPCNVFMYQLFVQIWILWHILSYTTDNLVFDGSSFLTSIQLRTWSPLVPLSNLYH